ncbi:MAG: hypothetical protein ABSE73_09030 [Planctomycetota bacterium]
MSEAASSTATAPAVYRVQRWQRRGWRNVSAPLPRREAEAQATELKRRPEVSAFRVRVAKVDQGEAKP